MGKPPLGVDSSFAEFGSPPDSEPKSAMAGTEAGCMLGEGFGEREAVASEVVRPAMDALLKNATRIESVEDGVGVARESALALELKVGGKGAQAIHLVAHFSSGGIG